MVEMLLDFWGFVSRRDDDRRLEVQSDWSQRGGLQGLAGLDLRLHWTCLQGLDFGFVGLQTLDLTLDLVGNDLELRLHLVTWSLMILILDLLKSVTAQPVPSSVKVKELFRQRAARFHLSGGSRVLEAFAAPRDVTWIGAGGRFV
ncbi:hypothetical protein EYF80_046304 [Liparis tanakae]|uniref:Uncharacterized protein n=1 Tax=Liparis tanakae TaxID=230148 RepID=A0A4Z2FQJ9_9TELE|nr:hypothetical protein EYF80_046304 [Liparis tanakae]